MLSKMLSTLDSSYLPSIDTDASPEIQLRTIGRRKEAITTAKNGIEKALGTLRSRYQALLLFARTQDQEEVLRDADQFWIDQQGEQLLDQAQDTIIELDAQLIAALNIQTSLLSHLQKDLTTATGSLAVTDSPRSISEVPSQENQDSPHQTSPLTPSQGIVPPLLPIQLRRVELPTFDGDITQYHDFWSRFRTAVHDNGALSPATKFIYLTNSLKVSAALMIQGYDPSQPDNYRLAIEALRRRYDRPQYTHHLFLHKLEQRQPSSSSATSQRDTLCQIQSFILQLNRYEDTSTSLALMKLIRKKFPKETQLEVNKLEHRSSKTWTLPELLDGLNEVIEEYEKLDDYLPPKSTSEFNIAPVSTPRSRSPTPESRYDSRTCCFCHSPNHRSTRCHHYMPVARRRVIANRQSPLYALFAFSPTKSPITLARKTSPFPLSMFYLEKFVTQSRKKLIL
ncbi:unnamed protein product [Haemonchus placei]|uniref:Uncharacterized protein n=1 Tax=Haemonchus placei TaxID=6290 RepID=A0A0N4X744_HAEPC|nr:unnamed protein product [Haemonchus placei]